MRFMDMFVAIFFSNLDKDKRSCRAFSLEIALCRLQGHDENCADSRAYQTTPKTIGGSTPISAPSAAHVVTPSTACPFAMTRQPHKRNSRLFTI